MPYGIIKRRTKEKGKIEEKRCQLSPMGWNKKSKTMPKVLCVKWEGTSMVRYLRLLERSVNGEKGGILIYSNNHNFFFRHFCVCFSIRQRKSARTLELEIFMTYTLALIVAGGDNNKYLGETSWHGSNLTQLPT